MNKEQQELLDEAYKSYENYCQSLDINDYDDKDTFIKGVKLNYRYSNRWGLKIEERELSQDERYDLLTQQMTKLRAIRDEDYINYNIPTKLIAVTHNNKTIESYE
jgi:hypothetical protein